MAIELKIPEAGESITEVQIGAWLKSEGDYVERDEPVVEVETDKASMDLPAPAAGVLRKVLKQAGDTCQVGEVIAYIDDAPVPARTATQEEVATVAATAPPPPVGANTAPDDTTRRAATEPSVMPAARRMLAQHDLRPAEVRATGPGGRLLKEDVIRHAENVAAGAPPAVQSEPGAQATGQTVAAGASPAVAVAAGSRVEEAVPMTLLRRRVAERMVGAQRTAALLTTFNEIDMSVVMTVRKQHRQAFQEKYGVKLGIMSFFVKAAVDALKMFPQLNAEIRGTDIVYHNYYDIGVAVSTDRGLMVPVIRNAERLSFAELEIAIADLAARARDRNITPDELQGGTFTISNGGVFGSLLSTPIVNPPQSGVLGLHAIQDRPVAREGQVVIRPMMYVALTYDHRIVDGRESVTFLKRLKECIENPARMLIEV
ncbi:MAG: 2-oxoglutarate dehydrogenase complex dihydrolipoyllysine-residue succinyltransferase [Phycisphaerae bacterium]